MIEYITNKEPILKKDLKDIEESERQNYFWTVKAQSLEVTKQIQNKLIKSLENGESFGFKISLDDDNLYDKYDRSYWDNAYNMNVALAQSRGNWEQMQELKEDGAEYAKFSAITDGKQTPQCNSLHGKVMKIDEWGKLGLVPPIHYGCRSTLIQLLDEEVVDSKGKYRPNIKTLDLEQRKLAIKRVQSGFGKIEQKSIEKYVANKYNLVLKRQEIIKITLEEELNRIKTLGGTNQNIKLENRTIEIIKRKRSNIWIDKNLLGRRKNLGDMYDLNNDIVEISSKLRKIANKMGINRYKKQYKNLKVVLSSGDNIGKLASYRAKDNLLIVNYNMLANERVYNEHLNNYKDFAYYEKFESTLVHELAHFLESQYLIRYAKRNNIPVEKVDYIVHKKLFDYLEEKGYNKSAIRNEVKNISKYATKNLMKEKYSEIVAEANVLKYYKERNELSNLMLKFYDDLIGD